MGGCCDSEYNKQMNQYWKDEESKQNEDILPYHSKYLLTKNEWAFYKKLKIETDKYNLHILAKIRLADLVEVDNWLKDNGFQKYFSKIKSKHVDFVLCNPDNLSVKYIIELEDGTHNTKERAERDDFVDKVLKKCNYNVIHTYGEANISEVLSKYIK